MLSAHISGPLASGPLARCERQRSLSAMLGGHTAAVNRPRGAAG